MEFVLSQNPSRLMIAIAAGENQICVGSFYPLITVRNLICMGALLGSTITTDSKSGDKLVLMIKISAENDPAVGILFSSGKLTIKYEIVLKEFCRAVGQLLEKHYHIFEPQLYDEMNKFIKLTLPAYEIPFKKVEKTPPPFPVIDNPPVRDRSRERSNTRDEPRKRSRSREPSSKREKSSPVRYI